MTEYAPHRGTDHLVHYCRRSDPEMRWLCGRGNGGSVQREDLDVPLCPDCAAHIDGGDA